ncbi:hypothetical protein [Segatella maculosa]|nr:hypothetical protein [Segatella maculosa]
MECKWLIINMRSCLNGRTSRASLHAFEQFIPSAILRINRVEKRL